jgi:hypothetical protein
MSTSTYGTLVPLEAMSPNLGTASGFMVIEVEKLENLHAFLASEEYKTAGVADENEFVSRPHLAIVVGGIVPMWSAQSATKS